ncbi:hypothetical protein EVAR_6577_1 [Eumeta japonica]|uniref:Uncharacterized protein n=1 Tax=Eumeta variegata TaxID=151549 RepID=A0A4C1SQY3_EUMVA|nr:hypothetical protein EVAR_6577_1 [Eumeta japonica]
MAFSLAKLKNILNNSREGQLTGSGSLDPEIGFKLSLHPVAKSLYVTVIGARHLPSLFGLNRAHGYLVKNHAFGLWFRVASSFSRLIVAAYLPTIFFYVGSVLSCDPKRINVAYELRKPAKSVSDRTQCRVPKPLLQRNALQMKILRYYTFFHVSRTE